MKKIKKIATALILVGIMCGMAGCGGKDTSTTPSSSEDVSKDLESPSSENDEKPSETINEGTDDKETEAENNVSDEWKSLEFTLDGTTFTFPATCADVEAAGFMFDEEEKKETLEPNYYTLNYIAENEEGERFYVRFKNFTDADKTIGECDIYGFGLEVSEYRDVNPDVTMCNGVTFGMTIDQVKDIMGEPDYYYESDGDYDRKEMDYYVTGKSYDSSLELSFTNGILNQIIIVNTD